MFNQYDPLSFMVYANEAFQILPEGDLVVVIKHPSTRTGGVSGPDMAADDL